jgi:uncharacterized membrane protein
MRTGERFLVYGVLGWTMEVLFSGTDACLRRDVAATARTSLWMHPIYGSGGLLLEQIAHRTSHWPRVTRAFCYVPAIYGIEYAAGWLLRRLVGRCPWDYSASRFHLSGLVRADYAPVWFVVAWLFEHLRGRMKSPRRGWKRGHVLGRMALRLRGR